MVAEIELNELLSNVKILLLALQKHIRKTLQTKNDDFDFFVSLSVSVIADGIENTWLYTSEYEDAFSLPCDQNHQSMSIVVSGHIEIERSEDSSEIDIFYRDFCDILFQQSIYDRLHIALGVALSDMMLFAVESIKQFLNDINLDDIAFAEDLQSTLANSNKI